MSRRNPVIVKDRDVPRRRPLPVLIPVTLTREQLKAGKYDGVANFQGKFDQPVVIVGGAHMTDEAAIVASRKWSRQTAAAFRLLVAHETGDAFAIHTTLDSLYTSAPVIAEAWKRLPLETIARSNLPRQVSDQIKRARLVLWWDWKQKKLQPAVYCRNLMTALLVRAALRQLQVCLCCGQPFIPERTDQQHCSIRCRERFRQQRRRARLKQREGRK